MNSPLALHQLTIEYPSSSGAKRAVENFSLELNSGEILGLLGPNGAGKTSIISAVTSLVTISSGSIEIFGYPVGSRRAKTMVGLVPQELISYGFFSVIEIMQFIAGYFGVRDPHRIEWLLKRLQLWESRDKKVAQLSGGMKRRLLIAKALIHSPKLLLLDEPSAGVDVELRQILWDFVQELRAQGMTILLTTHYIEEAERLCDRIAIIHHGKLLALDQTQKLTKSLEGRVLKIQTRDALSIRSALNPQVIQSVKQNDREVEIAVAADAPLYAIFDELQLPPHQIVDLKVSEAKLEDAFKKIIREDSHGTYRR
jgi:ABC-2 type transport system ATP-binding protein